MTQIIEITNTLLAPHLLLEVSVLSNQPPPDETEEREAEPTSLPRSELPSSPRLWPSELRELLKGDRSIEIAPGGFPRICPNCGGSEVMLVYIWSKGPMRFPSGKCKWLDYPAPGWYIGELHAAPCPVCKEGQLRAYIDQSCGLTGRDLDKSLSDFHISGSLTGKAEALAVARRLLGMNKRPVGFVTFLGDFGVGKSHLLMGLVNGFRGIEVMARYSTLADLLASIREKFGDDHGVRRTEEIVEDLKQVRVLAIDEVDRVSLTAWAKETIFRLLDSRYREQEQLLTVLATNLTPEQFPSEMGYLASRIKGGVLVEVPGPDMRPGLGLKARRDLE